MDQFKESINQLSSDAVDKADATMRTADEMQAVIEDLSEEDLNQLAQLAKDGVDVSNEELKKTIDKLGLTEESVRNLDSEALILAIVKRAADLGLDAVKFLIPILGTSATLVVQVANELMTNPRLEVVRDVIAEVLPELLLDFVGSKVTDSKVKENYALSWILSIAEKQLPEADIVELLSAASTAAGIAQDWKQSITDALLGNIGKETLTKDGIVWDIFYTPKLTIARSRQPVFGPDVRVFKIKESVIQTGSNKLLSLIPIVGGVLSGAVDKLANADDIREIKDRISQSSVSEITDFLMQLYQAIQSDKLKDQANQLIDDANSKVSDLGESTAQNQPAEPMNDATSSAGLDSSLSQEINGLVPDLVQQLKSEDPDLIPGGNFASIPVPARGRERKKY